MKTTPKEALEQLRDEISEMGADERSAHIAEVLWDPKNLPLAKYLANNPSLLSNDYSLQQIIIMVLLQAVGVVAYLRLFELTKSVAPQKQQDFFKILRSMLMSHDHGFSLRAAKADLDRFMEANKRSK